MIKIKGECEKLYYAFKGTNGDIQNEIKTISCNVRRFLIFSPVIFFYSIVFSQQDLRTPLRNPKKS
jgi:hypothetical protein